MIVLRCVCALTAAARCPVSCCRGARRRPRPKWPPGRGHFSRSIELGPMVQTYFGRFSGEAILGAAQLFDGRRCITLQIPPPVVPLGPSVAVSATGVMFWSTRELMFVRVRESHLAGAIGVT